MITKRRFRAFRVRENAAMVMTANEGALATTRLKVIDRAQLLLRTVDVERLILSYGKPVGLQLQPSREFEV